MRGEAIERPDGPVRRTVDQHTLVHILQHVAREHLELSTSSSNRDERRAHERVADAVLHSVPASWTSLDPSQLDYHEIAELIDASLGLAQHKVETDTLEYRFLVRLRSDIRSLH